MEDIILEQDFSQILFKTSFIFGLNSIYGIYQLVNNKLRFNDVLLTNTLLFMTSINYWRHPTNGIRRKIDIAIAMTNIIYNTYKISYYPQAWICYLSVKMITVTYLLSWYYHSKNQKMLGTFYHSLVHIFGNVGNFIVLNV